VKWLIAIGVVAVAVGVAAFAHPPTTGTSSDDAFGRTGFVLVVGLSLLGVNWLDWRSRRPVLPAADIFVPTRLIVGLFSALAVMWVAYDHLVLDAFARGKFGYLEWLTQVTSLTAARGVWNVWTPYPQGTQLLILALQAVASTLAPLVNSDIWSSYTLFRLGFQAVFLAGPAILSVWLIAQTARPFGRSTATIAALTLALSFALLYYGAATVYVTDGLPAMLTIAGIFAVVRGRFTVAGLAIGLGTALKLFPILLLPALLVVLPRRAVIRVAAAALIVVALVFVPFAIANPPIFLSPLNWQSSRPPWETWFAFVDWVSAAPHDFPQPYFQDASVGSAYGWVFTGITPVVSVLQTPVPAGPVRWENLVSIIGTLAALALLGLARRSSTDIARSVVRWYVFALSAFFIFAIGWSPQYELYLLPLILLTFEDPMLGAMTALALQALTFVDYPLLLSWAEFYGGSAVWLDWAVILARYALLGWLCVYVVRTEAKFSLRRAAPIVLTAACVPFLLGASHAQSPDEPCGITPTASIPVSPFDSERDWAVGSGWFFTESSLTPGTGYQIVDDNEAHMWSEFQRLGGWRTLGFPASQRFTWHGLLSQATQRAVLQWSPLTGQVEFANVLDLMHDDGRDADLLQQDQIPPPRDVDEAGLPYETIASNRLAWLDARPAIKFAYCGAPGGADPVQLWGLPTSEAVNMGNDVYVLRTQRAAFQEWVNGAPWAAPGQVTIVLAGDLAKEFDLLPARALQPGPAPG